MTFERERFPRQLAHWSLHAGVNALPSFLIAGRLLELWQKPAATLAMLAAIATFALGYALLTSFRGPFSDPGSIAARAVRLGTTIRIWVTAISVVALLPVVTAGPNGVGESGVVVFFLPDFWCGLGAAMVVGWVVQLLGSATGPLPDQLDSFGMAYAMTVIEGVLLSLLLLLISFFCLVGLQIRDRRRGRGLPQVVE